MEETIAEQAGPPFVRLDFDGRSILYSNPIEIIEGREPSDIRACLDRLRGRNAAGFIAYEAGYTLEPKLEHLARAAFPDEPPLLWFGIFDHAEAAPPLPCPDGAWLGQPLPAISFADYAAAVEAIRTSIIEGEVYQVNFTFPCSVPIAGNPMAAYAQLRERAGALWSALVFTGEHWLISCSPELFFIIHDGHVTCRPMKGTAPPDSDPEILRNDPKNRSENLMILDLVRNDLSRLSRAGTVKVPRLFEVEHYPTVLQMTSTVVSELQTGLGAIDLLQTIYPCGSITGAPKIAAMQRIHELEDSDRCPRGPYTGSIGHVLANGDSEFNVAIRTLVIANGAQTARYNVGSGIVIDSGPVPEWRECLQKAAFVASTTDFQLIETFALGPSRFSRAALHLDRLEGSAHRLGFAFDRSKLESELDRIRERLHAAVRLRILLERAGCFHVENAPLPVPPRGGARVSIAPRPVSADDFRLAHKTSDRAFYDLAREACGTFEVLFTDEEGFLTEGSFTNLFVHDGQRFLTPPLRRGLLPGILRQELIKKGAAVERDLKVDDLRGGFWIGNSLRGLIPAALPLATVADG